jgi:hypothetical protein
MQAWYFPDKGLSSLCERKFASYEHFLTLKNWRIKMRPLPISAETAIKLSEQLKIPIEQLMHMPQHILMQKMLELEKKEKE